MAEDLQKVTYFAKTNSRGKELPFGIKRIDRRRHMYVIGKTGMGKSTTLENLAIQDIRNGEGLTFIDPHGGTADKLLEYVPEHRINDVVYFAPFDMDYPIAFNVMEDVGYDKRHLVVSGLMAAFRKIWVDAWSARMEYILQNVLLALLEYPGATLLDVNPMLINKAFRAKVVENIGDPVVKKFWAEEFAGYSDRYTQDATPAIQNKIGQFANNPLIRNIIGQSKSSFDFRKAMDDKKIVIINLSKGRVGESNGALLGSMLVTKIYLSAMSRADVPANVLAKLPDHYFYVDEFQNFANKSFIDILSEARKYKLNLIIAHQFIEQVEEDIRNAVFGNVGTTIVFRVGPFDAKTLETLFEPTFMAADLVNLGFAQIYLTLMIDGVGSMPFSATTLPPFDPPPQLFVEQVIAASRRQFAKPREEVEKAVSDWQAAEPAIPEAPKPAAKSFGTSPRPPMSAAPRTMSAPPRPFAARPYTAPAPIRTPAPAEVPPASVAVVPAPVPVPSIEPAVVVVAAPLPVIPAPSPVVDINRGGTSLSGGTTSDSAPAVGGGSSALGGATSVHSEKAPSTEVSRPPFSDRPRPRPPLSRPQGAGDVRGIRPQSSQQPPARDVRPPLEGNTSLREALLRVGGAVLPSPVPLPTPAPQPPKIETAPPATPPAPAPAEKQKPDLAGMLRAVAPAAAKPIATPHQTPLTPALSLEKERGQSLPLGGEGAAQTAVNTPSLRPKVVPEEKLRAMLHVEPLPNEKI